MAELKPLMPDEVQMFQQATTDGAYWPQAVVLTRLVIETIPFGRIPCYHHYMSDCGGYDLLPSELALAMIL